MKVELNEYCQKNKLNMPNVEFAQNDQRLFIAAKADFCGKQYEVAGNFTKKKDAENKLAAAILADIKLAANQNAANLPSPKLDTAAIYLIDGDQLNKAQRKIIGETEAIVYVFYGFSILPSNYVAISASNIIVAPKVIPNYADMLLAKFAFQNYPLLKMFKKIYIMSKDGDLTPVHDILAADGFAVEMIKDFFAIYV